MKKYSIKDIAKLCNVSVATVSRVINDNGRFSEETRQKVLKAIEETGYQMNYSAKSLRMNKSFTIGILIPDISNYFFADVVQKIEEILFNKGYSTIICNTARNSEKEDAYLKMLASKGVDGIIVISGIEEFSLNETLSNKKIPYICIDREPKNKEHTVFISSNHYQGAFEATETLLTNNSRFPIIVMHQRKSSSSKERLRGFIDALKKNHLSFDPNQNILTLDFGSTTLRKTLSDFLEKFPNVDGIFAINDSIAMEIMSLLKQIGKSVPEDVKVIGFDNAPMSKYSTPTLSTVKQNTSKLADEAVKNLLSLIEHPLDTGKQLLVPVSLVLRESSQI